MSSTRPQPAQRLDPLPWVIAWVLTRGLLVLQWRTWLRDVEGDVGYYWGKMENLPQVGLAGTMQEYPTPVVWGMQALHALAPSWPVFVNAFVAAILLLDAAFTALLWRTGSRGGDAGRLSRAMLAWIAFIPLVGVLVILRFDLLPAVLAGGALLTARRRPRVAGALIAVGAAIKLWPALLVLPLLARRRTRGGTLLGFGVVGVGLALASLLAGGWGRTVSPLTWQSERGLQVESLAATPFLVARTVGGGGLEIHFSQFNAFEVFGPGVGAAVRATSLLTAVGLAVILVLWVRLMRSRAPRPDAPALLMLAIILIMIVTNKTLSPQYVVWLAGPLAAGLLTQDLLGGSLRNRRLLLWGGLALALLTQLVYPVLYDSIIFGERSGYLALTVLVVRNLLLLAATVACCWWTWQATRRHRVVTTADETASPR